MLECVPNVSEGRRLEVIDALAAACGPALLDVHSDPDHHRSVFTLAGPGQRDAAHAIRMLALAVADRVDLVEHEGVHPRFGALDVAPFVALGVTPDERADAVEGARGFAVWIADALDVPSFLYGDADQAGRSLSEARAAAFHDRDPDFGPSRPHPRLGAVAVGARPPLVAVNCELDHDDLVLARRIAGAVRERHGGLAGVRALGFRLSSRGRAQVSMNVTDLGATGLERACTDVRNRARKDGADVARVELVGLLPRAELERCSEDFRAWAGLTDGHTIESRLADPTFRR